MLLPLQCRRCFWNVLVRGRSAENVFGNALERPKRELNDFVNGINELHKLAWAEASATWMQHKTRCHLPPLAGSALTSFSLFSCYRFCMRHFVNIFHSSLKKNLLHFVLNRMKNMSKKHEKSETWRCKLSHDMNYSNLLTLSGTLKFALEEVIPILCNKKQFNYSFAVSVPHFFACLQTFYQTKTFLHELSLWN